MSSIEEKNNFEVGAQSFFTVLHMFIYYRHENVVEKLITLHRYKLLPRVRFHSLCTKTYFK